MHNYTKHRQFPASIDQTLQKSCNGLHAFRHSKCFGICRRKWGAHYLTPSLPFSNEILLPVDFFGAGAEPASSRRPVDSPDGGDPAEASEARPHHLHAPVAVPQGVRASVQPGNRACYENLAAAVAGDYTEEVSDEAVGGAVCCQGTAHLAPVQPDGRTR